MKTDHMGPVDKILLGKALVDNIIARVASAYDVRPIDIRGRRRFAQLSEARQMVMHLLVERGGTLAGTGRALTDRHGQGRDHGTVIHACKKISGLIDVCARTRKRWDEVKHLADPECGFKPKLVYQVFMSANVEVLAEGELPRDEIARRATARIYAGRAIPKMVDYIEEKI